MKMNCTIGRLASLIALALIAATANAQQINLGNASVAERLANLRPGEYAWVPALAPTGPLLLIVNIKTQRALLYRNGIPIGASSVSTGRPGYVTPTGVFTILQKHVEHYSSTYDNAPMPYMQRLTWRGVALHAGRLPGFPASHGCIRLPTGFARLLYGATKLGMTVVVTDRVTIPRVAPTPQLALTGARQAPGREGTEIVWQPDKSPSGPVSIIVSSADGRASVLRNGIEIGSAPVTIAGKVVGTWAYALRGSDGDGQHWLRMDLGEVDGATTAVGADEWQRFDAPAAFRSAVAAIVVPGTTIIVTADSLKADAPSTAVTVLDDAPEAGDQ